MATPEEVAQCLGMLSASFPNFKLPAESTKMYAKLLQYLPVDVLHSAVLECASKCRFFPTIAEIRESAEPLLHPQLIPAAVAWGEAVDQMRWRGHSWEPQFDNPVTQRCVEALGWCYLCMSTNQVADRARFIELYDELARRHMTSERTHPLVKQLVARMSPALLKSPYYEQLPRGERIPDNDEIESAFDRGEGE
jgi:hypothetical protein